MPRPAFLVVAALLLAGCATQPTPTELLTDADRVLLEQAAQKALEDARTGQSVNWHNPETGRGGTIMPTRTHEAEGAEPCRDYQQTVTVEGRTEFRVGARCRQADGSWVVTVAPRRPYVRHPYHRHPYYRPYRYHHLGPYDYRPWFGRSSFLYYHYTPYPYLY
jgi:surface antigen